MASTSGTRSDDSTAMVVGLVLGAALAGFLVYLFTRDRPTASTSSYEPATSAPAVKAQPFNYGDPGCRSEACWREGICTRTPGGACIAGSDYDCEQSIDCRKRKHCKAEAGHCVTPR